MKYTAAAVRSNGGLCGRSDAESFKYAVPRITAGRDFKKPHLATFEKQKSDQPVWNARDIDDFVELNRRRRAHDRIIDLEVRVRADSSVFAT
jgi:hypothetical protein